MQCRGSVPFRTSIWMVSSVEHGSVVVLIIVVIVPSHILITYWFQRNAQNKWLYAAPLTSVIYHFEGDKLVINGAKDNRMMWLGECKPSLLQRSNTNRHTCLRQCVMWHRGITCKWVLSIQEGLFFSPMAWSLCPETVLPLEIIFSRKKHQIQRPTDLESNLGFTT